MTTDNVDYRELIKKFMLFTGESEGGCYFSSGEKPKHLTEKEWAELLVIEEEVLSMPFDICLPTVEEWDSKTVRKQRI